MSSLSLRDQPEGQDPEVVGCAASGKPEAGLFRVWTRRTGDPSNLPAGDTESAVEPVSHHGGLGVLSRRNLAAEHRL